MHESIKFVIATIATKNCIHGDDLVCRDWKRLGSFCSLLVAIVTRRFCGLCTAAANYHSASAGDLCHIFLLLTITQEVVLRQLPSDLTKHSDNLCLTSGANRFSSV